jgi:signal transduction histidine kinase
VDDVTDRLRPQLEDAGCSLRKDYSGDIMINADSYRIEQVLVNILVNAKKYGAGCPVLVKMRATHNKVLVEIHDEGPGIKKEDCERIFRRFERAVSNQEVSGLGLGLFISREIMELHSGKILVESEPGKGSTFILELPL